MDTPWIATAAIISLGGLFVLLPLVVHTFQRHRHKKVVKCPETGGLAEVDIDAPPRCPLFCYRQATASC